MGLIELRDRMSVFGQKAKRRMIQRSKLQAADQDLPNDG